MPIRNGSRHLPQALDSLAAQTRKDFRLIVCDDGSTDDTAAIVQAETRFTVTCFRNESRPGIVSALNQLIEAGLRSGSPYLARFDADDICHPERFARQVAFLESRPDVGIVGSNLRLIDAMGSPAGEHRYPESDEAIRFELLFEDALAHPALLLRATVLADPTARYAADYEYAEDYDLWCRLALRTRFANLPEDLLTYRRHQQAVSAVRQQEQAAATRRIRAAYLAALQLPPRATTVFTALTGLAPWPLTEGVSVGDAVGLRRSLRRRFPAGVRSASGCARMLNLTQRMFVTLSFRQKLTWMLREPEVARIYLRARRAAA